MRSLSLAVALMSCGSASTPDAGPQAGGSCTPVGGAVCSTVSEALFCEGGAFLGPGPAFVAFACPGVNGCTSNASRTVCDFRGTGAGSPCPRSMESKAVCNDAMTFLQCVDGGFATTRCRQCSQTGDTVTCTP